VMLVEGAAEVFLIPPLVKQVMDIDLERESISVIAIHGVHFGAFARLFKGDCLPKRCAIVADADLDPADNTETAADEDQPVKPDIAALEGDFVKAFLGPTTFERELTVKDNLKMLSMAANDLGAVRVAADLEAARVAGQADDAIKDKVLRTAIRFGKARFAQTASRHVKHADGLPPYIIEAVLWLLS